MSNEHIERPVDRRLLLRGGAVLAGAAGVTAVGAAFGSPRAEATVPYVVLGDENNPDATTSLIIDGEDGSPDPVLSLTNVSGPSLHLTPAGDGYDGGLSVGDIANTSRGPDIGVADGVDSQTTWLATGLDLDEIPFTFAVPPERLLDTRTVGGRARIRTTSADAFDDSFRLRAGAWMDVGITETSFIGLEAAFVSVVAVKPVTGGYVTVYPPGDRPASSTMNFRADFNAANAAFIQTGVAQEDSDWYVVRIFSTAVVHVVLDLTGVTLFGVSGLRDAARGTTSQRHLAKTNRMKRALR